MATSPAYAATPVIWAGLVPGTADGGWTAPSNITTLGSAGASGTKITQIDITPAGTVVAGLVNVFLSDGSAYHLVTSVTIGAATVNTTNAPLTQSFTYDNLVLPASTWSLRVTNTIAGNESLVTVNAFGADF